MIKVDLLATGRLQYNNHGNIVEAHSTSVLIRTDDYNIVVDPSTKYMEPTVRKSLKHFDMLPNDIDIVILTHSHRDHTENIGMYSKACIYMHSGKKSNIHNINMIYNNRFNLVDGVVLVYTPGHCLEEMSVFVSSDRRYVIAGDAIPLEKNYIKNVPPAINIDKKIALESIKRIVRYADIIIPGHDIPFMVNSDLEGNTRDII